VERKREANVGTSRNGRREVKEENGKAGRQEPTEDADRTRQTVTDRHRGHAQKNAKPNTAMTAMTAMRWERRQEKAKGDEPDPRHWWKTAVAASFPT